LPVLGLDTSTRAQSIAVARGGRVLARAVVDGSSRQSETIVPAIRMVLTSARLGLPDLTAIAVTSGPGRFTGLRVAMATGKGLSLGRGIPVRGFSTLLVLAEALVLAEGHAASCDVCPILEAGRGQVYSARFRARRESAGIWMAEPAGPERVSDPEDSVSDLPRGTLVGGDGAAAFRDRIRPRLPDTAFFVEQVPELAPLLALRGEAMMEADAFEALPALVPNYIRPPDAALGGRR